MAQNDALTFYVKFMEDSSNNIKTLVDNLSKQLKNMVVRLDSKNIDVSGLQAKIDTLKGAKVVDTNSLKEIENTIKVIKTMLKDGLFGTMAKGNVSGVLESMYRLEATVGKVAISVEGLSQKMALIGKDAAIKEVVQDVNNLKNALDNTTASAAKAAGKVSTASKNDSVSFFPVTDKSGMVNAYIKAIDEVSEKLEKARARQVNFSDIQDVSKITTVYQMWGREIQNLENQLNSLYQALGKVSSMRGFNETLAPALSLPYSKEERSFIEQQLNAAFGQPKYDFSGMEKARQEYSSISNTAKELYDVMMRINSTPALKHLADSGNSLFERLKAARQELMNISTTGVTSKGFGADEFLKSLDFKSLESELSKFISSAKNQFKELDRAAAESKKQIEQTQTKNNKNTAEAELQRLKKLMQEVNAIQAKSPKLQIEGLDKAKQELQALIDLMNKAKKEGTSISGIDMGRWSAGNANLTIAELTQNQHSAATAAAQHAQEQQRMEQAIASATGKAQQQSQVLSDLRSMATQYLSVWGATSFVKEIAQITGELELQQRSLEVIIGSANQAQELFNNIKGLSQMSPFTFQDLLKSTRQLAAFGVETKDLYDTMKSLSDLGAGLSVDVQRLILAYGHVKSAGVLSGIQRRQFETAGINITGEIAKVYNQRYERAGSDERVTNADIFKKITKREIGFEDVEQAIKNLTSEGGKFYNMQLRQYETLGGKLRNLRNNYNIMLDDIGKKYMELLTGGVDALNSMMENWRTWGALIKSVTAALVAAKVASLALGKSWKSMSAARNAARQMRYEAQAMAFTNRTGEIAPLGATAQAATRFNWKFWQGQQRTMLPPSYAPSVINAEGLNKFQKLRMALHKDVASFDRAWIAQQLGYGQQYQKHIAGLNGWRLGMERMKVSAQSFFTTMRAGFLSIATNPMVWIGAAIAGITALVNKANEINTAMEHSTENTKRIMKEDIENINSNFNPIKNSLYDDQGNFNKEALDTRGFQATFDALDEIMQNHDPLYKGHLFDLKMMGDETEIIKGMISDIEAAKTGKEMLERTVGAIQAANADTGYNGTVWSIGIGDQWSTLTEKMHQVDQDFSKFKSRLILDGEEVENALKEKLPNVYKNWQQSGLEFEDYMVQFALKIKQAPWWDGVTREVSAFAGNDSIDKFHDSLEDLVEDLNGVKNKVKDVATAIAKGFDPKQSIEANTEYLDNAIRSLFNTEGSEVKDPEMQEYFVNLILANLPDESMAPQIRDHLYNIILKANLSEAIKAAVEEGKVDPNNIDDDAIADIGNRFNVLANKLANSNVDKGIRESIRNMGRNIFKDFKSDPTPAIIDFDKSWQRVYNAITDPNDPRRKLIAKFETQFKNSVSDYEFWAAIDKEVKSIKERLAQMRNVYTVLQTIKIRPEMLFDSRTIQKQIDDIVREMTGKLKSKDYVGLKEMNEYVQGLAAMRDIFKASELSNRSLGTEDREKYESKQAKAAEKRQKEQERAAEKAKRAAEKRKQEQEKAAQEAERKEIERIRNRIQQLQDLRREYKDLRQDNSKEAAMRQTQERYRHDYGENGVLSDAELNAIEDYSKILDEEIKAIKSNKKILNEEHRKSLIEAARRAQSELNNIIFKEKSDQMLSTLNSDLQKLLQQYESAKKVIDATGDAEAASQISGIGITQLKGGWLDNILESVLNTRFAVLLQSYDLDPSKYNIDYKRIAELDEKGIEEYVKDLIGDEQTSALVKAISTWLKEFKRQHDNVGKSAVDAYAKAIGSAMDYESQIMRINSELKEQNDLIDRSDASPEEKRRAKEINDSRAEIKRLELGSTYKSFFDGIFDEPMAQLEVMRSTIEGVYARALRNGAISAEEYSKKIEEINKVMQDADLKNHDAWWNKGIFDGRTTEEKLADMRDRGKAMYDRGFNLYQQAMIKGDQTGARKALEMMSKGKGMTDEATNKITKQKKEEQAITSVIKKLNAFKDALDFVANIMDSFGVDTAVAEDTASVIGATASGATAVDGISKALGAAGPWGAAAGAVLGLASGLAQLHDKALQRKIDEIKLDTTKMNNTLESIRSLRERQLGYDNGDLRRALAAQYGVQNNLPKSTSIEDILAWYSAYAMKSSGSADSAMREYYTRYSNGSGYEQELELLKGQREKIMEMYDLENKKKKKSKEELESYKQQIADLDEQIMFFTEDLANNLWGIDLKGWADQLGDALMTAFENGSSAAAAFKDTVQDIMRGVVKNMLTVGIIEPALENLRVKLFGNNGNGGLFDPNNPKGSMGAVLNGLSNWFETEGPQLMDAANEFYNGADNMMRQILGYGMRENEKSTNTVNSISSAASEETMGIVAGYLSRLSQDVSVQRIMQEMFVNGSWPSYIEQVTSVNNSISSIDRSTTAMMEMMRDGTGALYERVENVSRRLDNFANGIDRITVM